MTDVKLAIQALKDAGIEAVEGPMMLIIPCDGPVKIYETVRNAEKVFKKIDFQKSWEVDPYYYEKRKTLTGSMFLEC